MSRSFMKRAYQSENRKIQAEKTKLNIMSAAKSLFKKYDFNSVTINMLAEEACVSAPTIFALYKSKAGVLKAIVDTAYSQSLFEELVKKAKNAETIEERIRMTAHMATQIYEAERELILSLQGVSGLTQELKALEKEQEERRYKRQEDIVGIMFKQGELNPRLSLQKARDILWAFTGRDLFRMLVIERNWTTKEYEAWLTETLATQLRTRK